jgi:hypothetical protein
MNGTCTAIPTWRSSGNGGEDERITGYGALEEVSGEALGQTEATKYGAGFAACLKQIAQTWPDYMACR